MTSMIDRLDQYVAVRRSFGGNWLSCSRQVRPFAAFADAEGAEWITTELFLRWKERFGTAGRSSWAVRLSAVRTFAAWLQGIDPRTEIPPRGLVPASPGRRRPHIHSDGDIRRIMAAASELPSRSGLRGPTCATLFGLLAVTGMRLGETLGLDEGDIDLDAGLIRVRHTKADRERHVPVTACTAGHLGAYLALRARILGPVDAVFCAESGARLSMNAAEASFVRVCQTVGLREPQDGGRRGHGPRLHDLRHTLATRAIIAAFRQGRDVDAEMVKLGTLLGHAKPGGTFWYVEAVPELLALASARAGTAPGKGDDG